MRFWTSYQQRQNQTATKDLTDEQKSDQNKMRLVKWDIQVTDATGPKKVTDLIKVCVWGWGGGVDLPRKCNLSTNEITAT